MLSLWRQIKLSKLFPKTVFKQVIVGFDVLSKGLLIVIIKLLIFTIKNDIDLSPLRSILKAFYRKGRDYMGNG